MRVAQSVELSEKESKALTSWSRGRRTPTRLMKRAKIVLMAAQGQQEKRLPRFWELTPGKRRAGAGGLLSNGWRGLKRIFHGVGARPGSENEWLL